MGAALAHLLRNGDTWMLTIMRRRDARELAEAVLTLREQLAEASEVMATYSPAMGCCGCGAWMADILTPASEGAPHGESYCWSCASRHRITKYIVLPGRERTTD
jgi:hypothetical protein